MTDTQSSGNAAYDAGHTGAVVFGAVMLVAGLYYVFKDLKRAYNIFAKIAKNNPKSV